MDQVSTQCRNAETLPDTDLESEVEKDGEEICLNGSYQVKKWY